MNFVDEGLEFIPHVEASNSQKREWEKIMRRGNRILKQHWKRVATRLGKKYSRTSFRIDLFAALKKCRRGRLFVHKVLVLQHDLDLILAVRDLEWPILCSVSKQIFRQSEKWVKRQHGSSLTFGDFYREASMATSDAVYGFTRPNIVFLTYAYHAMHRRIINAINENKPLCPWTQENKALHTTFHRTVHKMKMKMGREPSFEEVVKKLKLNGSQISAIRDMLVRVVNHSDLPSTDNEDDYLADAGFYGVVEPDQSTGFDLDVLATVEMDSWERAVLEAYLAAPHGSRGWQVEVANQHTNPSTGETYSRAAPQLALRRVVERIKSVHAKSLADAA